MRYEPGEPAAGFYNRYRNLILANLGKTGDAIRWQNVEALEEDEKLSPTFEDMILLNVLGLIDPRMPAHIKEHYHHLIGKSKRLMDFKADILVKIPTFLVEIENKPHNSTIHCQPEEHLGAMRYQQPYRGRPNRGNYFPARGARRNFQPAFTPARTDQHRYPLYCRLCHLTGQPEEVVRSHRLGDTTCPKISPADKQLIEAARAQPRVNALQPPPESANQLAELLGYDVDAEATTEEVSSISNAQHASQTHGSQAASRMRAHPENPPLINNTSVVFRTTTAHSTSSNLDSHQPTQHTEQVQPHCNFIKPIPSQILTVPYLQKKNSLFILS